MGGSSAYWLPVSTTDGSVITVASSWTVGSVFGGARGSPCAACKVMRRKCQPDCVFAPYFPPDNMQKFEHVHRVFGASNVAKILNGLHPCQREDAVNSLAYEADMRHRDPVYGCVGVIADLQHRLRLIQQDLTRARYELSKYQAAAAAVGVGSNAGPADFVGNPVPNDCTQNFINMVGHSMAAVIGGAGGFMQHDQFATDQKLARSYDAEAATTARIGVSGGGYSSSMGSDHRGAVGPS